MALFVVKLIIISSAMVFLSLPVLTQTNITTGNGVWKVQEADNGTVNHLLHGGMICDGNLTADGTDNTTCLVSNDTWDEVYYNCTYTLEFKSTSKNGSKHITTENTISVMLRRLVTLQMSELNLETIDGESFMAFSSLEVLNLSHNLLRTLDRDSFSGLICLQELDLSMNELEHIRMELFYEMSTLEQLDLSRNKITSLNRHTFSYLHNLRSLSLHGNLLSEPTLDFAKPLATLREIDLSHNKFTHIGPDSFLGDNLVSFVFRNTPTLKYVTSNVFTKCHSLVHVDLSENSKLTYIDSKNFDSEARTRNLTLNISDTNVTMINNVTNVGNVIARGRHIDNQTCYQAILLMSSSTVDNSSFYDNSTSRDPCTPKIVVDNVKNVSLFVGESVHAECYAIGSPPPKVTWQRLLFTNGTRAEFETISNGNRFRTKVTSLDFDGEYRCSAKIGDVVVYKTFYIHVNHTDIQLRVIASNSRAVVVSWIKKYHVTHHIVLYRAYEQTSIYTTQHISEYWKIFRINSLSPDTHYEICIASYSDVNDRSCVRSMTTREYNLTPGIHHNVLAIAVLVTTGIIFFSFILFTLYKCCRKIQVIAKSNVFVVGASSRVTLGEVTETTFLYANQCTDLDVTHEHDIE